MRYNRKCMLEVETGTLVFAILNILNTSLGSLISIGGLLHFTLFADLTYKERLIWREMEILDQLVPGLTASGLFTVLTVAFCVAFSFAVVLIIGVCKRKAALVKCYFVYGVTKLVIAAASVIIMSINFYLDYVVPIVLPMLIMFLFYGPILYMVYKTYKKFESEAPYKSFNNSIAVIQKY